MNNDFLSLVIQALIIVESGGNNVAVGDGGKAVGCLQIHPIMVKEVNRICKLDGRQERFTLADRKSRGKSKQMARIFFEHKYKIGNVKTADPAEVQVRYLAYAWNRGGDKQHGDKVWRAFCKLRKS